MQARVSLPMQGNINTMLHMHSENFKISYVQVNETGYPRQDIITPRQKPNKVIPISNKTISDT
jgi:hypothetical protein